jgi:hypothetical protein
MVSGSLIFDLLRQLPRMAHCWPRSFSALADYVLARSHLCHLAVARETQEVSGPAAALVSETIYSVSQPLSGGISLTVRLDRGPAVD